MKSGSPIQHDTASPVSERIGWHACIAAVVLVALIVGLGACGDEDFSIGGPLPSRPTSNATNPSATPDDN